MSQTSAAASACGRAIGGEFGGGHVVGKCSGASATGRGHARYHHAATEMLPAASEQAQSKGTDYLDEPTSRDRSRSPGPGSDCSEVSIAGATQNRPNQSTVGSRAPPPRVPAARCKSLLMQIYKMSEGYTICHKITDDGLGEPGVARVAELRYTHDNISGRFAHGNHAGQSVESLIEALERDSSIISVLGLYVVRFNGHLHSLNNRRLYALKEHQRRCKKDNLEVPVRIITPCAATAKFVLAFSSENDGRAVSVD